MRNSEKPAAEKAITIPKQQTFLVTKSNELIQQSRFTLTVQQNKILLFLISKIKPLDSGNEVYSISIRDFCKVCNIDYNNGKNIANAKQAIKDLADKSIWLKQEDGAEILLRWLSRIKLNHDTNHFEISFHEDIRPYLYDLRTRYTRYSLDNVLTMKSKYGIRLYEVLKSYQYMRKEITFDIGELKKLLDAEAYKRYPDFRRFVLEKALEDINQCSDLLVSYTAGHTNSSRAIDFIIFSVLEPKSFEKHLRQKRKEKSLATTGKSKKQDKKMLLEADPDSTCL